jgi:hypothetical protein
VGVGVGVSVSVSVSVVGCWEMVTVPVRVSRSLHNEDVSVRRFTSTVVFACFSTQSQRYAYCDVSR